jgi:hypothetical protein
MRAWYSIVLSCVFAASAAQAVTYKGINEICRTDWPCRSHLECRDGYCAMPSFLSGEVKECKQELGKKGVDLRSYVSVYGGDGAGGYCYYECDGMYDAINREIKAVRHALEVNAMLKAVYDANAAADKPATYLSPAMVRMNNSMSIDHVMLFDDRTPAEREAALKESVSFPIVDGLRMLPRTLADAHGFHFGPNATPSPIQGIDKVDTNDAQAVAAFLKAPATVEALEKVSADAKAAAERANADTRGICGKCKYCIAPSG